MSQENPLELASMVAPVGDVAPSGEVDALPSGEVDALEETAGDADADELDGDAPDFDES